MHRVDNIFIYTPKCVITILLITYHHRWFPVNSWCVWYKCNICLLYWWLTHIITTYTWHRNCCFNKRTAHRKYSQLHQWIDNHTLSLTNNWASYYTSKLAMNRIFSTVNASKDSQHSPTKGLPICRRQSTVCCRTDVLTYSMSSTYHQHTINISVQCSYTCFT